MTNLKILICKITSLFKKSRHEYDPNGICRICLHFDRSDAHLMEFKGSTALDFCVWLKLKGIGPFSDDQLRHPVSNSQIRRWLDSGAITINGKKPKANESIQFPITDLVFFKNAKRQLTVV